jgi:hypothetical protein
MIFQALLFDIARYLFNSRASVYDCGVYALLIIESMLTDDWQCVICLFRLISICESRLSCNNVVLLRTKPFHSVNPIDTFSCRRERVRNYLYLKPGFCVSI